MPEYIRARDKQTGHVQSIPVDSSPSLLDLFEVVDDTPGDYLPPEFKSPTKKSGPTAESKEK